MEIRVPLEDQVLLDLREVQAYLDQTAALEPLDLLVQREQLVQWDNLAQLEA